MHFLNGNLVEKDVINLFDNFFFRNERVLHSNIILTNGHSRIFFLILGASIYIGCPRGVMVKAMNCGIVVREFVLQSLSGKYPWERYEPPYSPSSYG